MKKKHQHEKTCRLLIHSSVLEFIETESAKALRTETGGVLAGFGDATAGEVHVTHASRPGPRARRTMFSFARDTEYCQEFLDSVARQSGGAIDYLGEWHKHHEHVPRPSGQDVTTSAKIALSSDYHVSECLLLIVGESNRRTSLRAFVVDSSGASRRTNWVLCTACDSLLPGPQIISEQGSNFQS
jgi:integrative and conjugative element protein (TIGR02256 family)